MILPTDFILDFGATDPADHGSVLVTKLFGSKVLGRIGTQVSQPWSIAKRTQAVYTLPCTLGERCLEVRTGNISAISKFDLANPR